MTESVVAPIGGALQRHAFMPTAFENGYRNNSDDDDCAENDGQPIGESPGVPSSS